MPSARALYIGFSACCSAFPEGCDVGLAEPAIAALIPAVRKELTTFLRAHLDTDHRHWDKSCAWIHLSQVGVPHPYLGARERGPSAEEWCAGLSDLEAVFEAQDCLVQTAIRVTDWHHLRNSDHELVREGVRLPAEEEAALLAEIAAQAPSDP